MHAEQLYSSRLKYELCIKETSSPVRPPRGAVPAVRTKLPSPLQDLLWSVGSENCTDPPSHARCLNPELRSAQTMQQRRLYLDRRRLSTSNEAVAGYSCLACSPLYSSRRLSCISVNHDHLLFPFASAASSAPPNFSSSVAAVEVKSMHLDTRPKEDAHCSTAWLTGSGQKSCCFPKKKKKKKREQTSQAISHLWQIDPFRLFPPPTIQSFVDERPKEISSSAINQFPSLRRLCIAAIILTRY